jgi:hypothetical protein
VTSTATLFESTLNVRPRALVIRICLQIGKPGVEKSALLIRDRDIPIRERIPQRLNKLQPILGIQPTSFFEKVRAHQVSIPPGPWASNVFKLTGASGEAGGVR